MIDQLLEKYLTAFKVDNRPTEIFVNPSKKDFLTIDESIHDEGSYRFIADAKNKDVYLFSPRAFHKKVWEQLSKELNDNRIMYKDPTLFGGATYRWENKESEIECAGYEDSLYITSVLETWKTHPDMFKFADKYFAVSKFLDKLVEDESDLPRD
jgi:hypothetical protein